MSLNLLSHVISVDEGQERLWEGQGIADKGGKFSIMSLTHHNLKLFPNFVSPLHT